MSDKDAPDLLGETVETWVDMAEMLGAILAWGWDDARLQATIRLMAKIEKEFVAKRRNAAGMN